MPSHLLTPELSDRYPYLIPSRDTALMSSSRCAQTDSPCKAVIKAAALTSKKVEDGCWLITQIDNASLPDCPSCRSKTRRSLFSATP